MRPSKFLGPSEAPRPIARTSHRRTPLENIERGSTVGKVVSDPWELDGKLNRAVLSRAVRTCTCIHLPDLVRHPNEAGCFASLDSVPRHCPSTAIDFTPIGRSTASAQPQMSVSQSVSQPVSQSAIPAAWPPRGTASLKQVKGACTGRFLCVRWLAGRPAPLTEDPLAREQACVSPIP